MKIAGQTPAGRGYWDSNTHRVVCGIFSMVVRLIVHPRNQEKWLALHFQVLNFPVGYTRAPISNIDYIKLPLCIWLRQLAFEGIRKGGRGMTQPKGDSTSSLYLHTVRWVKEMKSIYSIEASTWTSELVRTRDEKINQRKRLNWIPHENFSPFFLQCFFIGERPHGITSRWSGNFPLPPLHAGELHDVLLLCTKTFKIAFFFQIEKDHNYNFFK
jgi:hypothetical protein